MIDQKQLATLEKYYHVVEKLILAKQDKHSGLIPASTDCNSHGDYRDAWVRDNVYSVLAIWALALAYRKVPNGSSRVSELEESVRKCMRGLLHAMMRQSHKVEAFKHTQDPLHALHAKYNTQTGEAVVGDKDWGHLQLDATSIFVLYLAQITASNIRLVDTEEEVQFVQNLVWYIELTYRTPDYGLWERGNKINKGIPELNSSSIGMAKAALEAIEELDLFGLGGNAASTIHVMADEVSRCRSTLETLLPRESPSKEVDAALLSVISFPAFAVENPQVVTTVRNEIVSKLEGRYGCKRFLRDGHQCANEDLNRLYYDVWELKKFEHIECEWPLFLTYCVLDGLFSGDLNRADHYRKKIKENCVVVRDGMELIPELFIVPADKINAEKANPGSQVRVPNQNLPLTWAQSLYVIGEMIFDGVLTVGDIDPLHRSAVLRSSEHRVPVQVQVLLLAEDELLQKQLEAAGYPATTPSQAVANGLEIRKASDLTRAYEELGKCEPLHLSGRPNRPLASLATSKLYQFSNDRNVLFLPPFSDGENFYLTLESNSFLTSINETIHYLSSNWTVASTSGNGLPVVGLLIANSQWDLAMTDLLNAIKSGEFQGCPTKLVTTAEAFQRSCKVNMPLVSSQIHLSEDGVVKDRADNGYFIPSNALEKPKGLVRRTSGTLLDSLQDGTDLTQQALVLTRMASDSGLSFDQTGFTEEPLDLPGNTKNVPLSSLLEEVYERASRRGQWSVVRLAAAGLRKVHNALPVCIQSILIRGKHLTLGDTYENDKLWTHPLKKGEADEVQVSAEAIRKSCHGDELSAIMMQELITHIASILRHQPELFANTTRIRLNFILELLALELVQDRGGLLANDMMDRSMSWFRSVLQDHHMSLPRSDNLVISSGLCVLAPSEVRTRLELLLKNGTNLKYITEAAGSVLESKEEDGNLHYLKCPHQLRRQKSVCSPSCAIHTKSPERFWQRRRLLDGVLYRVPDGFYPAVWAVLDRCHGISIGADCLNRNPLCLEMTAAEPNFALAVDKLFERIRKPEFRQVAIEALMVCHEVLQRAPSFRVDGVLKLDQLITEAVHLSYKHTKRTLTPGSRKTDQWESFYNSEPVDTVRAITKALTKYPGAKDVGVRCC